MQITLEEVLEYFENRGVLTEATQGQLGLGGGSPTQQELPLGKSKEEFSGERFLDVAIKRFYKAPSEKTGDLGTEERQLFDKYVTSKIQGDTLTARIESINQIVKGQADAPTVPEIMAAAGALAILNQLINNYNPSTAGFLNEMFIAPVIGGFQVVSVEKGESGLPIEDIGFQASDGIPVSLKTYSPTTALHGSLGNLLNFFLRAHDKAGPQMALRGVRYLVVTKGGGGDDTAYLSFQQADITPENLFGIIGTKNFNFQEKETSASLLAKEKGKLTEETQKDMAEYEKYHQKFIQNFLEIAPQFGLNPTNEKLKKYLANPQNAADAFPRLFQSGGKMDIDYLINTGNAKLRGPLLNIFKEIPGGDIEYDIKDEEVIAYNQKDPQATKDIIAKLKNRVKMFKTYIKMAPVDTGFSYKPSLRLIGQASPEGPAKIEDEKLESVKTYKDLVEVYKQTGEREYLEKFVEGLKGNINVEYLRKIKDPKASRAIAGILNKQEQGSPLSDREQAVLARFQDKHYKKEASSQFEITMKDFIKASTHVGDLRIDRDTMAALLDGYKDRLEEIVAPIYRTLDVFTQAVNDFFAAGETSAASKAVASSEQLASLAPRMKETAQS